MKKLTKEQMEQVRSIFPEWFNGVEVGKWYRGVGNKLICITNLPRSGYATAYGFSADIGKWHNDDGSYSWRVNDLEEAHPEEVKLALIAEAKRRYKVGDKIDCLDGSSVILVGTGFVFLNGYLYASGLHDAINEDDVCVALFKDGQWASVISQEKPSLQDDIQALKDRWPDINFTVIAEEKK